MAAQFKDLGEEVGNILIDSFGDRETVNTLSGLRDSESVLEQILSLSKDISFETKNNLLQTLATEGPLKAQLRLQQAIFDKKRNAFVKGEIDDFDFNSVFKDRRHQRYKKQFDTEKERLAKDRDWET